MSVKRPIQRAEDDATVEQREHLLDALGHRSVPELEVPTVFFLPVFVHVQQKIDSPIQLQRRMHVEVCVNLQKPFSLDLMESAPHKIGIGDQAFDP